MDSIHESLSELVQPVRRVIIEGVWPEIDGGAFAIKRVAGDTVTVEADIFADGHDELACRLQYRNADEEGWQEASMAYLVNDRWRGRFTVDQMGVAYYRIQAWVDHFATWRRDLEKRIEAGQDVTVELLAGAALVKEAAKRAARSPATKLRNAAKALESGKSGPAFDNELGNLMDAHADRSGASIYDRGQRVAVDRDRARFSAWYEMFPRSTATVPGKHGTFRDVIARLPYVAEMGFDILYLPPIHPIGRTHRKGKNNRPVAEAGDVGSPWAIGGPEGGHKALNPDLGSFDDFHDLVAAAKTKGLEVAIDIAFQCSPDHPYVTEHPQWFAHRPDGSIRFAENPPKKYEDIYPIDFETSDGEGLWLELESVIRFWMDHGVRVFRVDNPHTKALPFWSWLLGGIRESDPDVIFLSEAFTRPKPRYYLAKSGFTQSYTYFAWRNTKLELMQYLHELTQTDVGNYFRPSFWPNTPDILHESLQMGGRPAFYARLVLAATLSSSYGIYGPAFELGINAVREEGTEDYLDSEKYEIKVWDLDSPTSLREVIRRVNEVRHAYTALQRNDTLRFLDIDNDMLLAYMKTDANVRNPVVVVVNLDPRNRQSGWVRLPLSDLGLESGSTFEMEDHLNDATYQWRGEYNYVELNPDAAAAHILTIRPPVPA